MTDIPSSEKKQLTYIQYFTVKGGRIKLFFLSIYLRIKIKHRLKKGNVNLTDMRRHYKTIDERINTGNLASKITSIIISNFSGYWIESLQSKPDRVILYLHGGAFMCHLPNTYTRFLSHLSESLDAKIFMTSYRLAPEFKWPSGLDDCYASYQALLSSGISPSQIVLAGDSAGGNLVLALLQKLKQEQQVMPSCVVLLSPFVDFTLSSNSLIENETKDSMFTSVSFVSMRQLYADSRYFLNATLSPLYGQYEGLPPMLFQASNTEMLRDDSLRVADKAYAAGVHVEVELYQGGLPHVFQLFQELPQAHVAIERICDFICRHGCWC